MPPESESSPKVEIAHVLTMDVVEYSTLLITEQSRIMAQLTEIVQKLLASAKLTPRINCCDLPTGDGMALVFFNAILKRQSNVQWKSAPQFGPIRTVLSSR